MSRQEDFIEAGIQNHIHHCPQMLLRGGYAYTRDREKLRSKIFEEGAEYGYQYAIPEVCHIVRMIYIQNGNKLPSDFKGIVDRRIKTL